MTFMRIPSMAMVHSLQPWPEHQSIELRHRWQPAEWSYRNWWRLKSFGPKFLFFIGGCWYDSTRYARAECRYAGLFVWPAHCIEAGNNTHGIWNCPRWFFTLPVNSVGNLNPSDVILVEQQLLPSLFEGLSPLTDFHDLISECAQLNDAVNTSSAKGGTGIHCSVFQ